MEDFLTTLFMFVKGMGLLGMVMILLVTAYSLKEGLVSSGIAFGSIFVAIIIFGFHEIFGEDFMAKFLIAIGTGLFVSYFIWLAKN